jgi:hypothetical protein
MPKQSSSAPAASSLASDPSSDSDRLDAIGRYVNLRDWSFAVVDLMEVAGQSLTRSIPLNRLQSFLETHAVAIVA